MVHPSLDEEAVADPVVGELAGMARILILQVKNRTILIERVRASF